MCYYFYQLFCSSKSSVVFKIINKIRNRVGFLFQFYNYLIRSSWICQVSFQVLIHKITRLATQLVGASVVPHFPFRHDKNKNPSQPEFWSLLSSEIYIAFCSCWINMVISILQPSVHVYLSSNTQQHEARDYDLFTLITRS